MNFFDDQYRAQAKPELADARHADYTISSGGLGSALSTAAMVEQLRIATRPATTLGLDPIYRHPDIGFRNVVLSTSIATSMSTASF